MPVALHALPDDGAVEHVERGKQGRRAVADVVVGHCPGPALFHRQTRLGAIQRLDLALLIDRQHQAVRRRVDVKADDVVHLGGKLRITAEFEDPQPVRRQTMGAPDFCTVLTAKPIALAIARLVQWVVSPGGGPSVRAINCATTGSGTGGLPGLRVLSCSSPSTPASMKRRCQRHTQGLETPARRMISAVPQPSAVARMICARHTCFWALLRSATTASSRSAISRPKPNFDIRRIIGSSHRSPISGIFCFVHTTSGSTQS